MNNSEHESNYIYGGFWLRVIASIIDTILIMVILFPVLSLTLSESFPTNPATSILTFFFNYLFPPAVVILFWVQKSATPGKMIIGLKIVDAKTGGKPSTGQLIGRYLGYYVSGIALCLGFVAVAFNRRKQGWHDKLAGTLVVKETKQ